MAEDIFPEDYPASHLLQHTSLSLVITKPTLSDNPIVFVNRAFEETTGYSSSFALGRNCRFLQGPGTDESAVQRIRDAVTNCREEIVTLKNYRADGSSFWNELNLSPVMSPDGELSYFLGVQRIVPSPEGKTADSVVRDLMLQEIQHRVKNHLAMVVSLIRTQARSPEETGKDSFIKLARRVEALQLLYEQLNVDSARYETVDIGAYVGQVVAAVTHLDVSTGIRVNVHADSAEVSIEQAVRMGLILSEVLTNALQHAFIGRDRGVVDVILERNNDDRGRRLALAVIDNGSGLKPGATWPEGAGSGGRIVKGMIDFTDATLDLKSDAGGTSVRIEFPVLNGKANE